MHYAYLLAEKGFRVALPEANYHGERAENLSDNELNMHFWEIVLTLIDEIEIVRDHFVKENFADGDNIGVSGTSMGGIVTLGALTKYPWIKAAVSLKGMPYYEKFALWQIDQLKSNGINLPIEDEDLQMLLSKLKELDLSLQPEKLLNRPLLFWHGKRDAVVPYSYTYQFYESIRPNYDDPNKLEFISDEKADHKVSRVGVLKTVEWFEKYLVKSDANYLGSSK